MSTLLGRAEGPGPAFSFPRGRCPDPPHRNTLTRGHLELAASPEARTPRQPRPATGSGTAPQAAATATLPAPAATALRLLQTCRHRPACRRHSPSSAPAPSILAVVVPSRRGPRPAAKRLSGARTTAPKRPSGEKAVEGWLQCTIVASARGCRGGKRRWR